jgi:hypothetical protein
MPKMTQSNEIKPKPNMATNTEPASALHQNPGNEMKKTSNQRQKKKQIHKE